MEHDAKTVHGVAEIVRRIEALRASSELSIGEQIEIAKRLVAIIEEDKAQREVQCSSKEWVRQEQTADKDLHGQMCSSQLTRLGMMKE